MLRNACQSLSKCAATSRLLELGAQISLTFLHSSQHELALFAKYWARNACTTLLLIGNQSINQMRKLGEGVAAVTESSHLILVEVFHVLYREDSKNTLSGVCRRLLMC